VFHIVLHMVFHMVLHKVLHMVLHGGDTYVIRRDRRQRGEHIHKQALCCFYCLCVRILK